MGTDPGPDLILDLPFFLLHFFVNARWRVLNAFTSFTKLALYLLNGLKQSPTPLTWERGSNLTVLTHPDLTYPTGVINLVVRRVMRC